MLLKEDALVIKVRGKKTTHINQKSQHHSAAAYVQHAVKCQITSQKVSSTLQPREVVTAAYTPVFSLLFSLILTWEQKQPL